MKTIKTRKSIPGLILLGLGAALTLPMSGQAQAQPDPNNAGKGQNPPNRAKRQKGQKAQKGLGKKAQARMQERELATAEAVAGKPLSEEQKQKVRDTVTAREEALRAAREQYVTDLATALNMDPDAVRLKMAEAKAKTRGAGRRGAEVGAAADAAVGVAGR